MAGEYNQFVKQSRLALGQLDSPRYKAEALRDDISPRAISDIQSAMKDPRHQGEMQQRVLGDELERVKAVQAQYLKQVGQKMPQQLGMSLSPAHTGEPWPSPEATMIRLMLQMQRRYPGMQSGPTPQVPF